MKKRTKRGQKRLVWRIGFLLVACFLGWVLWQYYQMSVIVQEQRQAIEAVRQDIKKVKEENRRLERELQQMGTEGYLEKIAREDYGMIKDGEKIIVLPDEEKE